MRQLGQSVIGLKRYFCCGTELLALLLFSTSLLHAVPSTIYTVPPLPPELNTLSMADEDGIIIDVKDVSIRGAKAIRFASLTPYNDHYRLFFSREIGNKATEIDQVELDLSFNQGINEFSRVSLGTNHCEDPRLLAREGELYLFYTNLMSNRAMRWMNMAKINSETLLIDAVKILWIGSKMQTTEKNWSPFWGYDEAGNQIIGLEYQIYPREVVRMDDLKTFHVERYLTNHLFLPDAALKWKWGQMRGGTQGHDLGNGENIAFFHSSFISRRTHWSVIAAYTYKNQAPFALTGISPYPLLFKTIYSSPCLKRDEMHLRPCSLVEENLDGRELLHLSCCENETTIRMLTLDKQCLLDSLVPLNFAPLSPDRSVSQDADSAINPDGSVSTHTDAEIDTDTLTMQDDPVSPNTDTVINPDLSSA